MIHTFCTVMTRTALNFFQKLMEKGAEQSGPCVEEEFLTETGDTSDVM